jgi:uncharacterized membrane protein
LAGLVGLVVIVGLVLIAGLEGLVIEWYQATLGKLLQDQGLGVVAAVAVVVVGLIELEDLKRVSMVAPVAS